jgi:hypothetical protein
MAFNRSIRALEAMTASEEMVAADEVVCFVAVPLPKAMLLLPIALCDSSAGTFLNPLVISPAFALMAANSALTEAKVSTGILLSAARGVSSASKRLERLTLSQ